MNSGVRWSKKNDSKIKMKNIEHFFKLDYVALLASAILLPIMAFHTYEYFGNLQTATRLRNSVKLMMKVTDMVNVNALMQQSLLTTLMWNNTETFGDKPAADAYKGYSQRMKQDIISGFNDLKSLQYGQEYSVIFAEATESKSVCKMVEELALHKIDCSTIEAGSMDMNMIMYLRVLVSLTDNMMDLWENERFDPDYLSNLFETPKFKNYIGRSMSFDVLRDMYYYLLVPLSTELSGLIDPQVVLENNSGTKTAILNKNKSWEYFVMFAIPLSIITAVVFWLFVYRGLQRIVFDFWHTGLLLPIALINKNPLLEKYFKTLEKRAASRFSFF